MQSNFNYESEESDYFYDFIYDDNEVLSISTIQKKDTFNNINSIYEDNLLIISKFDNIKEMNKIF